MTQLNEESDRTFDARLKESAVFSRPKHFDKNRLKLSRRDSQLVMKLLKKPPPPNAKLCKAARALLQRS